MGFRKDVSTGMNIAWRSLYISIRAPGWPGALSTSSLILNKIFFWAVDFNSGLKILSKPCCKQMYYHLGFVAPFMGHRQSRVSLILKDPGIFRVVNEHWIQLIVTSCISPYKRVSLEARHWFLSSYESRRRHLLPIEGHCIYNWKSVVECSCFH